MDGSFPHTTPYLQALQIEVGRITALKHTQPDIPVMRPGTGAVIDDTPVLKLAFANFDIYGVAALAEARGILQAEDVPPHDLSGRAIPPC